MKRILAMVLTIAALLTSTACGRMETPPEMEPKISQMRSICELAVMDCYYHNVAKFLEEDAAGLLFWQKDKHFWVEYSGIVKLGIDASLVTMDIQGETVTISIPEAKVLECTIDEDSLSADSYVIDRDSAKVTAEDEVKAFTEAQRQMEEKASSDDVLLSSAQERAKCLLEEYVQNIGTAMEKHYTIEWEYLDAEGAPLETAD